MQLHRLHRLKADPENTSMSPTKLRNNLGNRKYPF